MQQPGNRGVSLERMGLDTGHAGDGLVDRSDQESARHRPRLRGDRDLHRGAEA